MDTFTYDADSLPGLKAGDLQAAYALYEKLMENRPMPTKIIVVSEGNKYGIRLGGIVKVEKEGEQFFLMMDRDWLLLQHSIYRPGPGDPLGAMLEGYSYYAGIPIVHDDDMAFEVMSDALAQHFVETKTAVAYSEGVPAALMPYKIPGTDELWTSDPLSLTRRK